jgi:hypothetical protein
MSDKMALAEIIRVAAAALAEEASEEGEGMEAEDESEDEGPTPVGVRNTALRIKALRDAK